MFVYIKGNALHPSQYENRHFENKAKLLSVFILVLNTWLIKNVIRKGMLNFSTTNPFYVKHVEV